MSLYKFCTYFLTSKNNKSFISYLAFNAADIPAGPLPIIAISYLSFILSLPPIIILIIF